MARLVLVVGLALALAGCGLWDTPRIDDADLESIVRVEPPKPAADWQVAVDRELDLTGVTSGVLNGDPEARKDLERAGFQSGRAATHEAEGGRLRSLAMAFLFESGDGAADGLGVIEEKARSAPATPRELDASSFGEGAWGLSFDQVVPGDDEPYVASTYAWRVGDAVFVTVLSGPKSTMAGGAPRAFAERVNEKAGVS
jgi:hypothetical protein